MLTTGGGRFGRAEPSQAAIGHGLQVEKLANAAADQAPLVFAGLSVDDRRYVHGVAHKVCTRNT
jgi:hypothetical protein